MHFAALIDHLGSDHAADKWEINVTIISPAGPPENEDK